MVNLGRKDGAEKKAQEDKKKYNIKRLYPKRGAPCGK
jgi:hypothetical protein